MKIEAAANVAKMLEAWERNATDDEIATLYCAIAETIAKTIRAITEARRNQEAA